MKKKKLYLASAVYLTQLPKEHWANNDNKQKSILVRTTSQQKVAELISPVCSVTHLRHMGLHDHTGVEKFEKACIKDDVIYYEHPDFSGNWCEYVRKS